MIVILFICSWIEDALGRISHPHTTRRAESHSILSAHLTDDRFKMAAVKGVSCETTVMSESHKKESEEEYLDAHTIMLYPQSILYLKMSPDGTCQKIHRPVLITMKEWNALKTSKKKKITTASGRTRAQEWKRAQKWLRTQLHAVLSDKEMEACIGAFYVQSTDLPVDEIYKTAQSITRSILGG